MENFQKNVHYLKDFSLDKKVDDGGYTLWEFKHKVKNYLIKFYIKKNNSTKKWGAKVFVYWKTHSKQTTNGRGKDYELKFGPYDSYDEMVEDLNRKLKNNPISSGNYFDDNLSQLINDTLSVLKTLKRKTEDLSKVKDKYFDDLKKIAKEIVDINDDDGLKEYIDKHMDGAWEQWLWLTLHKVSQIDFYKQKEKIDSLF